MKQQLLTLSANDSSLSRSERGLYLFSAGSLSSGTIDNLSLDVSPSTLIPYYDPDTSLVILTGKVSSDGEQVDEWKAHKKWEIKKLMLYFRATPGLPFLRSPMKHPTFSSAALSARRSHIR